MLELLLKPCFPRNAILAALQDVFDVRLRQPRLRPAEASTSKPKGFAERGVHRCSAQDFVPRAVAAACNVAGVRRRSSSCVQLTNQSARSNNVLCSLAEEVWPRPWTEPQPGPCCIDPRLRCGANHTDPDHRLQRLPPKCREVTSRGMFRMHLMLQGDRCCGKIAVINIAALPCCWKS